MGGGVSNLWRGSSVARSRSNTLAPTPPGQDAGVREETGGFVSTLHITLDNHSWRYGGRAQMEPEPDEAQSMLRPWPGLAMWGDTAGGDPSTLGSWQQILHPNPINTPHPGHWQGEGWVGTFLPV